LLVCLLLAGPASAARSITLDNASGMNTSGGVAQITGDGQIFSESGDEVTTVRLKLDGALLPEGSLGVIGGPTAWNWNAWAETSPQSGNKKVGARATLKDSNNVNHTVDVPAGEELTVGF
jgi:hypothetical protein